jgi:hypothetical protein
MRYQRDNERIEAASNYIESIEMETVLSVWCGDQEP